ncbi:hypothetical protein [Paenarthrobacter nitroguajacolicus]|uniref:hypothetical protein n=1 Tax=Paenarthrobacter nitroguajacolicus TaxID=211146 RepID=UPI00248AC53B|nr:hypothetical protein [Paenarthrobacter nitroguajacolicus]MDI2034912.1 hypothetical protein [Paenarthrobacter nitroguajacolicus]
MTAQNTAPANGASPAHAAMDARSGVSEAAVQVADVPGQARAVVTVREQFNPLGAGLRSIWPQSVVGF